MGKMPLFVSRAEARLGRWLPRDLQRRLEGLSRAKAKVKAQETTVRRAILASCQHELYVQVLPTRGSKDRREMTVCVICGREQNQWEARRLNKEERRRIDVSGAFKGSGRVKLANVPVSQLRKCPGLLDGPVGDWDEIVNRCATLLAIQEVFSGEKG